MFLTTGAVLEKEKSICAAQLKELWADLFICLVNNSKTYRNRNLLMHWNFVLGDRVRVLQHWSVLALPM